MSEASQVEVTTPEPIDLENSQTNGQIQPKAFRYKVKPQTGESFKITVITTSPTVAKMALSQQIPGATFEADGFSEHIMQVNDQGVIDV